MVVSSAKRGLFRWLAVGMEHSQGLAEAGEWHRERADVVGMGTHIEMREGER